MLAEIKQDIDDTMVNEGQHAPDFALDGADGRRHSLGEFAGKVLILYFYPKDDTPGCTIEANMFNSRMSEIESLGACVVGISKDGIDSHIRFKEKHSLGFLLLSDPESTAIKAYGAYGDRGVFGIGTLRNTYIIGKDGKIIKTYERVDPAKNVEEVLELLKDLV
jgi:peroxiredoxin Q/BCP